VRVGNFGAWRSVDRGGSGAVRRLGGWRMWGVTAVGIKETVGPLILWDWRPALPWLWWPVRSRLRR